MADLPTSIDAVRSQILRDIELGALAAGVTAPPVGSGSDHWLTADAVARVAMQAFAHCAARSNAILPALATSADLEEQRIRLGVDPIPARGAVGEIIVRTDGSRAIPADTIVVLPGGQYAQVTTSYSGVPDRGAVEIRCIDAGSATNLPGGTKVRFLDAPPGVSETAEVSETRPLTGGQDDDSAGGLLRARIAERWAYGAMQEQSSAIIDAIRMACGSAVDAVWVYPALGGPATARYAVTQSLSRSQRRITRALPLGQLSLARSAAHAVSDVAVTVDVVTPAETLVHWGIDVETDGSVFRQAFAQAFPYPVVASTPCVIGTVTSDYVLGLTGVSGASSATAGLTEVAWFSRETLEIVTATVAVATSGGGGAWTITLDRPLTDSDGNGPSSGDYIFPAPRDTEAMADAIVATVNEFGPGENKASPGRASRVPSIASATVNPGGREAGRLVERVPGLRYANQSYTSASVAVPGAISSPPNILRLASIGIWPRS